jgi:NUMOD4 motif-containing protein/HNH endonuclease
VEDHSVEQVRWRATQGVCLIADCQRHAWCRPLCSGHLNSVSHKTRVAAWHTWLWAHRPPLAEEERWLPIPGYVGSYEVSDLGKVRSCDRLIVRRNQVSQARLRGKMRTQGITKRGHRTVRLSQDGVNKSYGVHQLVMLAFVGPCPSGLECCHENGKASDNRLVNLRYDTHEANMLDMVRHNSSAHSKRDRCPRGHLLVPPNLVPSATRTGRRSCLACMRAHGISKMALRRGVEVDFKAVSDRHYIRIMGTAA